MVSQTAIHKHVDGHLCDVTFTLVGLQRGTAIVLSTAIDMSQWQCPRGTAQLFSTAGEDAGIAAEQS
jgi:hypothetical protein